MSRLSKQDIHEMVVSGKFRETFTSTDFTFKIDITRLREMVIESPNRWPLTLMPVDKAVVEFLYRAREIDEERVLALTDKQLADPVFAATFQNGLEGVCPIDGHHRIIRLALRSLPTMVAAYLIPWQELPHAEKSVEVEWGDKQVDLNSNGWRK